MMVKGSPASSLESIFPPDSVNKGPAAQDQASRYSRACPALTTIFSPILRPLWAPGGDNWGGRPEDHESLGKRKVGLGEGLWFGGFGKNPPGARQQRASAPLSKTVVL